MSPTIISDYQVKGRKVHRCFCCGGDIVKGEKHRKCTLKYDDVYSLRTHNDCEAASDFLMKFHGMSYWHFDDGIPPLVEMMDGGFQEDCNTLRGHFPHVVARLELAHELAEIKWQNRRSAA